MGTTGPVTKFLIAAAMLCFPSLPAAWSRDIAPIVSTDWLQQNLRDPSLVIVDIRTAAQYQKEHIPGSFNIPFGTWAVTRDGLSLELPADEGLRTILGNNGISPASKVVIAGRTETDFARADATRVAWTCRVAGIESVAVLDGGFTLWSKEGRTLSNEIPLPKPVAFAGPINRSSAASMAYILGKLKDLTIADNRTPEDYFGITSRPGHIMHAVDLPAPWVFHIDGTFKDLDEIAAMASGVLGNDKSKEIVLYCGVGGYAATWWFLLTELLGYQNVRLYDGSFEEWIQNPKAPVQSYSWH